MSGRRTPALLAPCLTALALLAAGCGAQADDPEAKTFTEPEPRAVAATVQDVSDAAAQRDYEQICSDYLAEPLVRRLDDAVEGADCPDRIETSLQDVSATELTVRDVRVTGTNAVAVVQPTGTGDEEAQARFLLVKEGPRWKLSGIG